MNIFLFQQREWYFRIGKQLAEFLIKKKHKLSCLTFKRTTHDDVLLNSNNYELIINHDEIVENPKKFIVTNDLNLERICKNLNIETIWEIFQSARNHIKNYNLKPSYGFSQNLKDHECIDYLKSLYEVAESVHKKFKPDIIILPAFVSLPHIVFDLYFKRYDIPTIGLTDSKIDKNVIFVNDYLQRDGRIFELFSQTEVSKISEQDIEKINTFKKKFFLRTDRKDIYSYSLEKNGFKKEIKIFLKTFVRLFKSVTKKDKNIIKSIGYTPDNNVPSLIIRDYYFYLKNKFQKLNYSYYNLEDLDNYVYFPLQFQPEDTIDIMGAKYNNQIETIRQVAMRLPHDLTLVVKDHPAMDDLREKKFLDKIKNLPNVKLVSSSTNVDKILERSKLVVYITGTIAFECSMKKIPCIQLGEQGLTKLLPNVNYCNNINNLPMMINKIINSNSFDEIEYDENLNKYIYCVQKIGFDSNYYPIWEKNEKGDFENINEKFYEEIQYYKS